jgi:hypothetical protein
MRTTVTLDPDVEALLRKAMHEHRTTFKEAINDAVRQALSERHRVKFETPTFDLGPARVDLDRALALAGALEDELRMQRMGDGR